MSLDGPSEADLSTSLLVLLGNILNELGFGGLMLFSGKSNLNVRSSSKVRVSHHLGAGLLNVSQESVLYTEGMQLNLEDSGLDCAVLEDFSKSLEHEVRDSDISS